MGGLDACQHRDHSVGEMGKPLRAANRSMGDASSTLASSTKRHKKGCVLMQTLTVEDALLRIESALVLLGDEMEDLPMLGEDDPEQLCPEDITFADCDEYPVRGTMEGLGEVMTALEQGHFGDVTPSQN